MWSKTLSTRTNRYVSLAGLARMTLMIVELWDAVTNAERIPRWFAAITGELKLGGRYQLEGNAGGDITRCDAPTAVDITWEYKKR